MVAAASDLGACVCEDDATVSELDDLRARVRVQAEQIAALQEAAKKLIRWVVIVTRPVADYGPANDERCQVDARDLYYLMQTADLLREALAPAEGRVAPAHSGKRPAEGRSPSDDQKRVAASCPEPEAAPVGEEEK